MPWIQQIPIEKAMGRLKNIFDTALRRAGRVWNIVHIMSLNPRTLDASMKLYGAAMHGPSPLSRMQREMLATVVSRSQECFY